MARLHDRRHDPSHKWHHAASGPSRSGAARAALLAALLAAAATLTSSQADATAAAGAAAIPHAAARPTSIRHLRGARRPAAETDAALWRWLEDGGAVMAFHPGYSPQGVRGGFATADIPAGGVVSGGGQRIERGRSRCSAHRSRVAGLWTAMGCGTGRHPHLMKTRLGGPCGPIRRRLRAGAQTSGTSSMAPARGRRPRPGCAGAGPPR
jgi:hypothetical protein